MRQDNIKRSLDARLSGIQAGQNTAWQVLLAAQQKEKPIKKKLSFALAATLALILAGVALAAGLDVFGLFKKDEVRGKQLEQLSEVAQTYAQTTTFPAQEEKTPEKEAPQDEYQRLIALQQAQTIEFTLQQAYANDKSISLSYTLKDAAHKVSYHEGVPSGNFEWLHEDNGRWADTHMLNTDDAELNRKVATHLNQPGSHYIVTQSAGVGDGASLTDGTDLPIRDSQIKILEDGSVQGYMTCRIPDGVSADKPLEVELIIGYGSMVICQEETGHKTAIVSNPADKGMKRIHFTVARSGKTTSLSGALTHEANSPEDSYTAQAQVFLSPVNVIGAVTIKGSQVWVDSWQAAFEMQDGATTVDRIYDYVLYAGEQPYANRGGSISLANNGDIVIGLDFDAPASGQPLTLRPVYRDGEAPGEAIPLQ